MPRRKPVPKPKELTLFPERLRLARRWAGVGVNELGILTASSGAVISRLESGARAPETAHVIRIADKLGVRAAWLLLGEEPMVGQVVVAENTRSAVDEAQKQIPDRRRTKTDKRG